MKTFKVIDCTSKSVIGKHFTVDLNIPGPYLIESLHPTMTFRKLKYKNGVITLINSNIKIIGREI